MTWGNQNTRDDAFNQMDFALDSGVNFFDTAELYPVPANADTYGVIQSVLLEIGFQKQKNVKKLY